MPLIVQPDHYGWWLGEGDLFKAVLSHPDRDELFSQTVSRALNYARNEGPGLLKPDLVQTELI